MIVVDFFAFSVLWHQYFDSQALDCHISQERYLWESSSFGTKLILFIKGFNKVSSTYYLSRLLLGRGQGVWINLQLQVVKLLYNSKLEIKRFTFLLNVTFQYQF